MKKIQVLVLLLLSGYWSGAQKKDLDSLYNLLSKHPQEDTLRIKLLYQICYYEYTSDNEKNKLHANEALRISEKLHFKKGVGYAQKYLALYYWMNGDYDEATTHGFSMLKALEGTSNYKGLGQAYAVLGSIYQDNRDFEKSRSYYLKALEIHQLAGLKQDVGYDYNGLATLNQVFDKYDQALENNLKAMEVRIEIGDENGLSQTYGNITLVYKAKKEYDKAIEYALKALPISQKLNNKYRLCGDYANLGSIYTLTANYSKSEYYLLKSLELAKSMNQKFILTKIYSNLAALESKRGNYKKAIGYLEAKQLYKDSIYTETKAKKVAEVEIRYETAKKDNIILALEQQKEIQSLKQLYFFIALLILVMAFLAIYLLQRSYNRNVNRLLNTEKSLNLKLQEADQLKSSFFTNISHEFRTPLSLILAPVEEKLSSSRLTPSDKDSFLLIRRNANRLLTLVNQLLDLSKLEARKMELQIQNGNLKEFLMILTTSFDSLAENKKIHFKTQIHLDTQEGWFDADKLEKIVNNLLFNAFKFTLPEGIVTFSASFLESSGDLKIVITDTGKGIPWREQQFIFKPFYQSNNVADGQIGTGLGLPMVKEFVKLYGGQLELQSDVGIGTVISITLPMIKEKFSSSVICEGEIAVSGRSRSEVKDMLINSTDDNDSENIESSSELSQDTILIVDDNEDLRNFISNTLRNEFTTLTAKDGEEGLATAIELIPNLIISDIMMPKLGGVELAGKLKTDERTSHIPIILLTAKADLDAKIEGLQAGADDYLSKPFSTEELRVRVINLIEQRKRLAAKYRTTLSEPAPPKEASLNDKFLSKARQIVEENIDDSNFGVEKMADEIHLSRTQLFRKLKAICGLSPNEFINDIRLEKAAELIRLEADTLTQISYSVGYNDQSYFTKRFRKKFGITPTEYRTTHVKN